MRTAFRQPGDDPGSDDPESPLLLDQPLPEPAVPSSADSNDFSAPPGVAGLHSRLADAVRTWEEPRPDEPQPVKAPSAPKIPVGRSIKTLLALAVVVALGWTPLQRFLQTTSAEATVNARLVTLRAPIDGEIAFGDKLIEVGTSINKGDQLLEIDNPRTDTARFDDLRRQIITLQSESAGLEKRKSQLESLTGQLREQRDAFQKGRIEELEARIAELGASIESGEAEQVETSSTLDRTQKLRSSGYQSEAALIHANREHRVAERNTEALRQRLRGAKVELDAARKGLFVGDSYNDIPRTAQRMDEVEQQIIDINSQVEERRLRIGHLQEELAGEKARVDKLSSATISVPVNGRVWEVLTANGEEVQRGQPLLRVLDCSGAVVTAAVSEATYNNLRIGQAATFHLRGESEERTGKIIGLNGLAAVPANLAIEQNALAREPYHVTVQIPSLGAADCEVGRTGKVTFDTDASGAVAANP